MKLNDTVWFMDAYGNLCSGKITAIHADKNYYDVKEQYGSRGVLMDQCYPSREACLEAAHSRSEQQIAAYMNEIKSLEDLVRFMYNHNVARAEEYTDWDARQAAASKATEFGIQLFE